MSEIRIRMRISVIDSWIQPCRSVIESVDTESMWDRLTEIHFLYPSEIVLDLYSTLSDEDREYIRTMPKKDMFRLHHTLGQYIRNTYGLWHPKNPNIVREHPDDTSGRIIEAFYDYLNSDTNGKPELAYDRAMSILKQEK